MSSILSSLAQYLRGALKTLGAVLRGIVKQAWPILILAVVIYFAPTLLNWASAAQAPAWLMVILEKAFSVNVAIGTLISTSWAAFVLWFGELSFAYQLVLSFGVMYLLNPEGAVQLAQSVIETLWDVTKPLRRPVEDAVSSLAVWLGLGAGLLFLSRRTRDG